MTDDTITIGSDGLGRDARGVIPARFVDSFTTAELVHPGASVICLRLYDATTDAPAPGQTMTRAALIQVRMSADRARALAQALIASADALDANRAPER